MERFLPNLCEAKLVRWRDVDALTIARWMAHADCDETLEMGIGSAGCPDRWQVQDNVTMERAQTRCEADYIYNCA